MNEGLTASDVLALTRNNNEDVEQPLHLSSMACRFGQRRSVW